MIQLIQISTGKRFDLPTDVEMSIEVVNPFFGETSTFSLPVNVPTTSTNMEILGYVNRNAARYNAVSPIECVLICGLITYHGYVHVLSSTSDSFEITFISDELDLAKSFGETTLANVFDNVEETYNSISDLLSAVQSTMGMPLSGSGHLNKYAVFPVIMDGRLVNEMSDHLNSGYTGTLPSPTDNDYTPLYESDTSKWNLDNGTAHTIKDAEDREYKVPGGYNVSPFLFVWYILKQICAFKGYSLSDTDNIFLTNAAFRHAVVLNNTIDACCDWQHFKLYYKHLVPDITVSEFIKSVQSTFGVSIIIDGSTAKTVYWNDIISRYTGDLLRFGKVLNDIAKSYDSSILVYQDGDAEYAVDGSEKVKYWVKKNDGTFLARTWGVGYKKLSAQSLEYELKLRYGLSPLTSYIHDMGLQHNTNNIESANIHIAVCDVLRRFRQNTFGYAGVIKNARNKIVSITYDGSDISKSDECPLYFAYYHEHCSSVNTEGGYYQPQCMGCITVASEYEPSTQIRYGLDASDAIINNLGVRNAGYFGNGDVTMTAMLTPLEINLVKFNQLLIHKGQLYLIKKMKYTLSNVVPYSVECVATPIPSVLWNTFFEC